MGAMTFLEAALEILRRERKPLHYKDITTKAMDKKLLTFVGRTPEVTMQTQLTAAVKKTPGNPFVRVKPGTFGLLRYPEAAPAPEPEEKPAPSVAAAKEGDAAASDEARTRRRRRGGRGRGGRREDGTAVGAGGEVLAAKSPAGGSARRADPSASDDEGDGPEGEEEPEIGSMSPEARAAALAESGVLGALGDDDEGDEDDLDEDDDGEDEAGTGDESATAAEGEDESDADESDEDDEDDDDEDEDDEDDDADEEEASSEAPPLAASSESSHRGSASAGDRAPHRNGQGGGDTGGGSGEGDDEGDDDSLGGGGSPGGMRAAGGELGAEAESGGGAGGGLQGQPGFETDAGGRRRRRRRRRRGGGAPGEAGFSAGPGGDEAATGAGDDLGDEGEGAAVGTSSAGGEGASAAGEADSGASRRIMSPVDAAIEILKGQAPGRGMHVRQLADAATRRRLVHGEANEAWRVMRAALAAEPRERLRAGQRPRVRAAGSGLFALARRPPDLDLERAEHVFGEARRALRERTLAGLEQRLVELSPSGFEAITRVLLQREGFGPATFVKRVEGTVYLEALRGRGIKPSRCLIALRPGGTPAGRRAIGELRAGIRARNQDEGVLLLGARLAEDGVAEWKQPGPPIEVADGAALAETCLRHGVGVINTMVSVDFVDADFFVELQEG
jgi:hypothetical protein